MGTFQTAPRPDPYTGGVRKAVVQRVASASVKVDGEIIGSINMGLLVYLGVGKDDIQKDVEFFANKIANLRIFEDENGKMNLSALTLKYDILVVSQFTLYGDVKKGFRPSFQDAAEKDAANSLYELLVEKLKERGLKVETGVFQAMMEVESINDGPVTILI